MVAVFVFIMATLDYFVAENKTTNKQTKKKTLEEKGPSGGNVF